MAGEFAQLLPFTWRGLHLPIFKIGISLAHDIVEHKYWGVDGGRIESTGIAPIRILATIPIANSIFPGKSEKWDAGTLYPNALRKFMLEFAKKETGYLQHPEFGEIACKPEKYEFELSGDKQDCTEIHASWVETLDDEVLRKLVPSPVRDIELAAANLEASGESFFLVQPSQAALKSGASDLKKLAPNLPEFKESIESLGRKLTSVVDTVSVLQYRVAGLVNRIIYQAHRLEVAIQRAASGKLFQVSPLRPFTGRPSHALTWPVVQALQRIKAAAYVMRRALLDPGGIGLYTVPALTTLAGLVNSLPGVNVASLIRLNPNLVRGPIVRKGAVVRYPLSK